MHLFTHSQQQFVLYYTNVASDQMKRVVGVPESEESNLIIYIMELGFAMISSKLNEELKWLTGIRRRRSK